MPIDPEEVKKLIRSSEFQRQNKMAQIDQVRGIMAQHFPEYQSGEVDLGTQLHEASQVIDYHTPGFLSKVADILPVIGPIKRAYEDPDQIRPWTRAAAGLLGADKAVQSPFGAAMAEGLREVAELAAFGAVAGPIGKYVGAPIAEAVAGGAGGMFTKGITQALGGVPGAAATLAKAGGREALEKIVARAATDGTIGALYSAADVAERGEFHPLQHLLVNPLAGAAFGAGLEGLHATFSKYGPTDAAAALRLLQENPDLQAAVHEAMPIKIAYARAANIAPDEAGGVVARAINGELLAPEEFETMKGVLTGNSRLLKSEAGMRILQTQKEHLAPSVKTPLEPEGPPAPLSVRYERPSGATETVMNPTPKDLQKLMADHYEGRIHVLPEGIAGEGAAEFVDSIRDPRQLFEAYDKEYPLAVPGAYKEYLKQTARPETYKAFSDKYPGVPQSEYEKIYPQMKYAEYKKRFGISEEEAHARFQAERARIEAAPPELTLQLPEAQLTEAYNQGETTAAYGARPVPGYLSPETAAAAAETPARSLPPPVGTAPQRGAPQTFVEGHPTQAPVEGQVFRPTDYTVINKLREKHGDQFTDVLAGEQLGSALPSDLRAALTGETTPPVSRGRAPTPPTPTRQVGDITEHGTVVDTTGAHTIVQDATGQTHVTVPDATGRDVKLVESPGGGIETQAAAKQRQQVEAAKPKKPGPKAELEKPIGELTDDEARRAFRLLDKKMGDRPRSEITPEEMERYSALSKRTDPEGPALSAADLQICVRIR